MNPLSLRPAFFHSLRQSRFVTSALSLLICYCQAADPAPVKTPSSAIPLSESLPSLSLPKPAAEKKPMVIDMTKVMPPPPDKSSNDSAPPPAQSRPDASSTSANGQFVVRGADLATRSAVTKRCEGIAKEMHDLLHDPKPWGVPIVVAVRTAPDIHPGQPAVSTDIRQLDSGGFHLQLTLEIRPDLNTNDLRNELIRMLVAERIVRDHKALATTRDRILPEWILTGIREALTYRARSRPSTLFAAIFRTGKVYGISEILESDPGKLDALSRAVYETSCCGLVLALLDQADGSSRFAKLLSSLAVESKTDRELLNANFPGIAATNSSLDKWWSLQMASLATPSVFESMGPAETLKAIDAALVLRVSDTVEKDDNTAEKKTSAPAEVSTPPEPRKGIFNWLFTKDDEAKKDIEDPKKAKPEPAKSEPKVEDPVAPAKPPGILRNLFRRDKKEEAEPDNKAKPKAEEKADVKPKAAPVDKLLPKPEPKSEPKSEAKPDSKPDSKPDASEKPGSGILRNLFKRNKKEEPESKTEEETKSKKSASVAFPSLPSLAQSFELALPNLALFSELFRGVSSAAVSDGESSTNAHRIAIKLFGKKDPDAAAKEAKEKADREAFKKLEEAERDAKAEAAKAKKEADQKAKLAAEASSKKAEAEAKAKANENPKDSKPETTPVVKSKAEEPPPAKPAKASKRTVTSTLSLDDYAKLLKRSDANLVLDQAAKNLSALQSHAHPLFRPVIKEYIATIAALQNRKTKGIDERLAALKASKAKALEAAKAVQDYLDFYEASQTTSFSGLFDDYLRIPEEIEKELPKRTDPISQALDEAEQQFSKPAILPDSQKLPSLDQPAPPPSR